MSTNGFVMNSGNPEENNTLVGEFRVGEGDVVELRYSEERKELRVENLTREGRVMMSGVGNEGKGLGFCVYSY